MRLLEKEEASKLLLIWRVSRQLSVCTMYVGLLLSLWLFKTSCISHPVVYAVREKIWSEAEAKAGAEKDEKRGHNALQIGILADILLLTDLILKLTVFVVIPRCCSLDWSLPWIIPFGTCFQALLKILVLSEQWKILSNWCLLPFYFREKNLVFPSDDKHLNW